MIKWGEANLDMRADKTTQSILGCCFQHNKEGTESYTCRTFHLLQKCNWCYASSLHNFWFISVVLIITMADLPPSRSRISGPSRTRIGGGGRGGGTCRTPPTRGSSASWPGRASPARTAGASCSSHSSSPSLCRGGYFPRNCSFTL